MSLFKSEKTEDGVTERLFDLTVAGEVVPAVLWTPEGAKGTRPLICMGHGGSQHKRNPNIKARASAWARRNGWATLAIDGPGHGDRITKEQREAAAAGAPRSRDHVDRGPQHAAEWKAAVDAVRALPDIGEGPMGYWGVSMGTRFGVPFVADEPRMTCAIFGLFPLMPGAHAEAAARIKIPLQFIFQWHDELMKRDDGIALFNQFGSPEKTMHINPGKHVGIPQFEGADWEAFYLRHLGVAADAKLKEHA
ncbi:MAG: dienelactone hydrolase family protein [Caulobacteraceae bacterium]